MTETAGTPVSQAERLLARLRPGTDSLKTLGLVSMIAAHAGEAQGAAMMFVAETVGRAAFPLFAIVIGINLARHPDRRRVERTYLKRLFAFGLISLPVQFWFWPDKPFLNILFTLFLGVLIVASWRVGTHVLNTSPLAGGLVATLVLAPLTVFVDYPVFGPLLVATACLWAGSSGRRRWLFGVAVVVLCGLSNIGDPQQMAWAAGFGAFAVLTVHTGAAGRRRLPWWSFYLFYPLHLIALKLALPL